MKPVYVGSTNKHKLAAVRQALEELGIETEVVGHKTRSGVPEQPVGFPETLRGARARAEAVQAHHPDALCLGIESGLLRDPSQEVTIDFAAIVLRYRDRLYASTSLGLMLVEECVREAEAEGLDRTTVGAVIARRLGGDPSDPHATLSHRRLTRKDSLVSAIKIVLSQHAQAN